MPQPYTPFTMPFGNQGMVTKVDPSVLQPGQYYRLINMVSLQEGAIVTRNGYKRLNNAPMVDPITSIKFQLVHTLARLVVGSVEADNFRYLGNGQFIYRVASVDNPLITAPIGFLGNTNFGKRWTALAYRKLSSGAPYEYFATVSLMLKDPLTDNQGMAIGLAQKWGLDRPVIPASLSHGAALPMTTVAGNCNTNGTSVVLTGGGPFDLTWPYGQIIVIAAKNYAIASVQDNAHLTLQTADAGIQTASAFSVTYATPGQTGPNSTINNYKYVYTFRNPNTGSESNPSMLSVTGGIAAFNQIINVVVNPLTAAHATSAAPPSNSPKTGAPTNFCGISKPCCWSPTRKRPSC